MLCVGDLHIKPTNVHLVDLVEKQIQDTLRRHPTLRRVMLLGDVLDTFERVHTQALNRAYQLIHTLRQVAHVYILVGNHDYINNQQFLTDQHWMNALKDWEQVTIVDRVHSIRDPAFRALAVPYVPPQQFQAALETADLPWRDVDYIFAHQEIRGCKMGAIVSTHGDVWEADAPLLISGHIHDPQQPQPNVVYVGACLPNAFGDAHYAPRMICVHGPATAWTEETLQLPKKKTIYSTPSTLPEVVLDDQTDMVRVVVRCEYEEFKVLCKSQAYAALANNPKIKVVHKPAPVTPTPEVTLAEPDPDDTFLQSLHRYVLQQRDEWLYAMYSEVVCGTVIDPVDILLV